MTDTSTAAVDAMINLLSRPHGNLTGGEKLDAAKMIAALSAQLEAANLRHAAALEAVARARDDALVEAANTIMRKAVPPDDCKGVISARDTILALRTQSPQAEPAQTAQEAVQPIRDAIRNSRVAGGKDE